MLNRATRDLLLKIIHEKMIPEYSRSEKLKEELRDLFLECLDKYLDPEEKRLIEEHPEYIKKIKTVRIFSYYSPPKDIRLVYKELDMYTDRNDALEIDLGREVTGICNLLSDLAETYPKMWKVLKPAIQNYCCVRNSYVEKWNMSYDALNHKNMTLTLLKTEFPELYKLYQGYGRKTNDSN